MDKRRNIRSGNKTLIFPTFEDIHREVLQKVNDFLDFKVVHQVVVDLLEMSDEGLQNAHSLYSIKTQIGEFTFLLNKNADTLSTQTTLAVSFEQTAAFVNLQGLTPEGVERTVPPNLFNVETDTFTFTDPPHDRIILYQEEQFEPARGYADMLPSLSHLSPEISTKFSSEPAADLTQYVRDELVEDFKHRASNLIAVHITAQKSRHTQQ